jgi:hypothetical protein
MFNLIIQKVLLLHIYSITICSFVLLYCLNFEKTAGCDEKGQEYGSGSMDTSKP